MDQINHGAKIVYVLAVALLLLAPAPASAAGSNRTESKLFYNDEYNVSWLGTPCVQELLGTPGYSISGVCFAVEPGESAVDLQFLGYNRPYHVTVSFRDALLQFVGPIEGFCTHVATVDIPAEAAFVDLHLQPIRDGSCNSALAGVIQATFS